MYKTMEKLPVFVYGTLKRGERNESVWPTPPSVVEKATVTGQLHDAGPYPCLIEGDDQVIGELFWFNSQANSFAVTLDVLDVLENYDQGGEDLYIRKVVECQIESGVVRAYAYFYNQPLTGNHKRIRPDASGEVSWSQRFK